MTRKVFFFKNANEPQEFFFMSLSIIVFEIEGEGEKYASPHNLIIKVRIGTRSLRVNYAHIKNIRKS